MIIRALVSVLVLVIGFFMISHEIIKMAFGKPYQVKQKFGKVARFNKNLNNWEID
jgi:hypothetical protein